MKKIVVCGDSFNYGIGCENLYTEPYGCQIAEKLDAELIRLARGSASNFATHLQAYYAATKIHPKPDLIIIGSTSYDRFEWVAEGNNPPANITLENLNYHQYPPHNCPQPLHEDAMPFYLDGNPSYKPCVLSEQFTALDHYLTFLKKKEPFKWYERLYSEPRQKIELMLDWCVNVYNNDIKRNYDIGVLLKAYMFVKKQGINCIVITPDTALQELLPTQDFINVNWFDLAVKFPDTIETMHASAEAHTLVANLLLERIASNGY